MRLLYPTLLLLTLYLICFTEAAPRYMIRKGGRLDRLQQTTLENWQEVVDKQKQRHHHHHRKRRHRHKRRHHKKRAEQDIDTILLDMDRIIRPRFG